MQISLKGVRPRISHKTLSVIAVRIKRGCSIGLAHLRNRRDEFTLRRGSCARNRIVCRIEQNHPTNQLRMQFCGTDGFGASVRMADQCKVSKVQVMSECNDILDQVVELISASRLLGLPKTTPGEADAMISRCKLRGKVAEDMRCGAQSREEHKRRTVAAQSRYSKRAPFTTTNLLALAGGFSAGEWTVFTCGWAHPTKIMHVLPSLKAASIRRLRRTTIGGMARS